MISASAPDFTEHAPFRHCGWDGFVPVAEADAMLDWLEVDAPWRLRIESFYEQHEFSLLDSSPPTELYAFVSAETISTLAGHLEQLFELRRPLF